MPALQNLGVHVIDQLSTRFGDHETTLGYIQSFRVTRTDGSAIDESRYKPLIEEILREEFLERTRNDPLNALALLADLNLGAIKILQLYRNLYLQLDDPYSRDTVNQCLLRNPAAQKSLPNIFDTILSSTKFRPPGIPSKSSSSRKRESVQGSSMRSRTSVRMSF